MTKFVTDVFPEEEANVIVFGVDCPESLREASQLVEPFDIVEERNLLENAKIFDAGDVKLEEVEVKAREAVSKGKLPLLLSKEHTTTLYAMKSMPKAKLVVFDAHADVKDEYEGSKFSHACWLRRWCELDKGNCERVTVVGVRSGDEEELKFLRLNNVMYFTSDKVKDDLEGIKERLQEFVGGSEVYVSVDMDVFDPSIAPSVKYPEPGGILYREFVGLLEFLKDAKLVGLDCVEIRPLGSNRITEFLAMKAVFKLLGIVKTQML